MLSPLQFKRKIEEMASLELEERKSYKLFPELFKQIIETFKTNRNILNPIIIMGKKYNGLVDLRNYNCSYQDYRGIDSLDFSKIIFNDIDLSYSKVGPRLINTILFRKYEVSLEGIDLSSQNLSKRLVRARTIGNDIIVSTKMHDLDIPYSNLQNCNATDCNFNRSNMQGTNMSGADISGASFVGTNVDRMIFTNCKGIHPFQFISSCHVDTAEFSDKNFIAYIQTIKAKMQILAAAKSRFERVKLELLLQFPGFFAKYIPSLLFSSLPLEIIMPALHENAKLPASVVNFPDKLSPDVHRSRSVQEQKIDTGRQAG